MSDKLDALERRLRETELALATQKVRHRTTTRWVSVLGGVIAALWGYSAFVQIPHAVSDSAVAKVHRQLLALPTEAQETLLPQLRESTAEGEQAVNTLQQLVEKARETSWTSCTWRKVGDRPTHHAKPDDRSFFQRGEFLVSFDLDGDTHNYVGFAKCCIP